jgi:hypothetical protein
MRLPHIALLLALLLGFSVHAQTKNDWRFPSPEIKEHYSTELKTTVYDLGDGFIATKKSVENKPLMFVFIPEVANKSEDSDLALVIASKVWKLPRLLSDTILKREDKFEFRFRTVSGRTAGVTLAHDRKSAIVRLLPVGEGGPEM